MSMYDELVEEGRSSDGEFVRAATFLTSRARDRLLQLPMPTGCSQNVATILRRARETPCNSYFVRLRLPFVPSSGSSLQRSRSNGGDVTTPKGRRSRSVPLSRQAAQVLAKLGQRDDHTRPGELVFARSDGGPLDQSGVRKKWYAARAKAMKDDGDIPELPFHGLRHTFGTLLASAGIRLIDVQQYMGHASPTTTAIYQHHVKKADAASRLTAAFGGAEEILEIAEVN